jgi:UDP-N-acetylglucosamine 4,6-dehydratase
LSSILITGGTGTFGRAFIGAALRHSVWDVNKGIGYAPIYGRVISLSRDEQKAAAMVDEFGHYPAFRAWIGDVRDRDRLAMAFRGVDIVIHAAALKRVDQGAYSPSEILQTNITGTMNVVTEAIEAGVKKVVVISSDKAVAPTNIYGASKFCAECYAVSANNYGHKTGTSIAAVRYGNVLGSRGSVVHIWQGQLARGGIMTVTHPAMSRFIMTIEQAVALVDYALGHMQGGEVFLPNLPSAKMVDLAAAVYDECGSGHRLEEIAEGKAWYQVTGLRPGGEKMAEVLLNEEEPSRTRRIDDHYIVLPSHHEWTLGEEWTSIGEAVPLDMVYRSDRNERWLTSGDLLMLMQQTEAMR